MSVDRSFAFIDLCGFTEFSERSGDEVAVIVLSELRTALREIAARRGVRVAKWLGDGAMLSSTSTGSLVAMTLEVRHRLRGAIPDLAVRVGMDQGPVIMFEGDDYIGRAVNVAARICAEAQADDILVTSHVASSLPTWAVPTAEYRLHLKGFAGATDVVAIDTAVCEPDAMTVDPVCGLAIPTACTVSRTPICATVARYCSPECHEAGSL